MNKSNKEDKIKKNKKKKIIALKNKRDILSKESNKTKKETPSFIVEFD